jgi:hypothetical protein
MLRQLLVVPGDWDHRAEHDALDARRLDRLGAGRRASLRAAGFERDVDRGAAQQLGIQLLRVANRLNLGMRLARLAVVTAPDDLVLRHDDRTHGRIGAGQTGTTLGLIERQVHPVLVGSFFIGDGRRHAGCNDRRESEAEKQ